MEAVSGVSDRLTMIFPGLSIEVATLSLKVKAGDSQALQYTDVVIGEPIGTAHLRGKRNETTSMQEVLPITFDCT